MKRYFYTHLVEYESILVELDKLDLSEDERKHLAKLIDESLHHKILDAVLSELSEEDKKTFLLHHHREEHDKLWKLLNEKVDKIEEKIKKAADDLKDEMKKDIQESQRLKDKK